MNKSRDIIKILQVYINFMNISPDTQRHLISAGRVFLASFLGVLAGSIGTVGLEKSAIYGLIAAAFSAGLKGAWEAYFE